MGGIVCDTICYQPIWHPTNLYRSHEDRVTAFDSLIISKGLSFSLYWISHFTFSLHLLFQNPRRLSFGGAKRKIKRLCTQLAYHRQKRVGFLEAASSKHTSIHMKDAQVRTEVRSFLARYVQVPQQQFPSTGSTRFPGGQREYRGQLSGANSFN